MLTAAKRARRLGAMWMVTQLSAAPPRHLGDPPACGVADCPPPHGRVCRRGGASQGWVGGSGWAAKVS